MHHVDLGARPARVPALAVVQGKVDRLIDQVLDDLPALEIALSRGEQRINGVGLRTDGHTAAMPTRP
jgi:hypothetical protein